jgi:Flp pilus assembly protein TadD
MGDPEAGLASLDRAIEMSPGDASMSQILQHKAIALFAGGDYDGARDAAQSSTRLPQDINNPHTDTYLTLAASLAHLGKADGAGDALNEARKLRPALSLEVASVNLGTADRTSASVTSRAFVWQACASSGPVRGSSAGVSS